MISGTTTSTSRKRGPIQKKTAGKLKGGMRGSSLSEYSPAWVLAHPKETPGYNLELIHRIRSGVKKTEWKQLIREIGATEKEFENILPTSISSMQKKTVYGKEASERIYELAQLYGLGYEVFDSREDFKDWLITSSRALGNKKPFELLDSSLGFDLVKNEIIRIQFNVYS
nr:DUF2384 domain-containing protein [Saprospiraceae bacterium]